MPRRISLDQESFEEIRSNKYFYIDKTSFIENWYHSGENITLITRPRGFGKTLTIDMLNCFFSPLYADKKKLFEGLSIAGEEEMMKLQGTVPTIQISLSGIKAETFEDFLLNLSGRISILYRVHLSLFESGKLMASEERVFQKLLEAESTVPEGSNENEYHNFILTGNLLTAYNEDA